MCPPDGSQGAVQATEPATSRQPISGQHEIILCRHRAERPGVLENPAAVRSLVADAGRGRWHRVGPAADPSPGRFIPEQAMAAAPCQPLVKRVSAVGCGRGPATWDPPVRTAPPGQALVVHRSTHARNSADPDERAAALRPRPVVGSHLPGPVYGSGRTRAIGEWQHAYGPHPSGRSYNCWRTRPLLRVVARSMRINEQHIAEPGLVVLDVIAADEGTVRAVMDGLQQLWATSGITPVWRTPGRARGAGAGIRGPAPPPTPAQLAALQPPVGAPICVAAAGYCEARGGNLAPHGLRTDRRASRSAGRHPFLLTLWCGRLGGGRAEPVGRGRVWISTRGGPGRTADKAAYRPAQPQAPGHPGPRDRRWVWRQDRRRGPGNTAHLAKHRAAATLPPPAGRPGPDAPVNPRPRGHGAAVGQTPGGARPAQAADAGGGRGQLGRYGRPGRPGMPGSTEGHRWPDSHRASSLGGRTTRRPHRK
ncbi:DUF6207 family protein [Streptomyces sp. NPDC050856]|uniref:DUF6207 family protein n=1 Tax=Streptomyces sp. NPDC050856 TaxID=3154939 RepID=UPI0033C19D45